MRLLRWLPLILLASATVLTAASAQEMQEMELERKRRDFEQIVETRLAGNGARARRLREQAEQAIQIVSRSGDPRPDCENVPAPPDFDVLTAELSTALNSTESRLKEDYRSYDTGLREYEADRTTDSWKIDRHFALRLQWTNLENLKSRRRSLLAIADSYRRTMPEAVTAVTTASCLVRGSPGDGDNLARSLSASLLVIIGGYRDILYLVQR